MNFYWIKIQFYHFVIIKKNLFKMCNDLRNTIFATKTTNQ